MIEVEISPVWRIRSNGQVRELDVLLIAVLSGLCETGKLTLAARAAGITPRHARNLIAAWNAFLGAPMVAMRRGLGTRLTPLGEQLLWTGRRIQSRLAPELDGLASSFARTVNAALGATSTPLAVHASHDFAVALLRDRLLAAGVAIEIQHRGSFDALASLVARRCVVAGFHVPEGRLGRLMALRYAEGLQGRDIRVQPLAVRSQGFIVPRGNPLQIHAIADLARPGTRLINRQRGSGTRALLESLLTQAGVARGSIEGYDTEEITHSAVAALVAGRQADVGFGIEAAAVRFGLDFVPIVTERYYLAVALADLEREDVALLLGVAACAAFCDGVDALPGYRSVRGAAPTTIEDAEDLATAERPPRH